ncbi:hypothetical protein B0T19DRAFT_437884 [Cercophora scortea]|uniref:Glycosyl transferase family 25 domain-containing protein n=1 Tax=Cercophora scortea TaxID=314031 RepID=A0AAE0J629_9PEZI|nr:hypothetical protein B0T19DRAFT_437884 [Cercophora scortea]
MSLMDDVNNATLGFEKILVVGLPSRTDRRDGMVLQAAVSNMKIDFIDGVMGADVPDKAVPKERDQKRMGDPLIGSWRAHMNAIHEVVAKNLSTALIMEDDVSWDVRLRGQLRDFAVSAHALTQPLQGFSGAYADETFPNPSSDSPGVLPDIPFNRLPATVAPKRSPYGDNWDVLWIGHCGMHFPFPDNKVIPKGRVIRLNDETVAQRRYLWTFNKPFTLKEKYPDHTRAVHHSQEGVCSLAYAVTQKAARQLLHELALKPFTDAFDIMLRFFCEGSKGRAYHNCLTLQPALFHHHRPVGPHADASNIGNHGGGYRDKPSTDMVRWSVRMNIEALLEGRTDFVDEYPDKEDKN